MDGPVESSSYVLEHTFWNTRSETHVVGTGPGPNSCSGTHVLEHMFWNTRSGTHVVGTGHGSNSCSGTHVLEHMLNAEYCLLSAEQIP